MCVYVCVQGSHAYYFSTFMLLLFRKIEKMDYFVLLYGLHLTVLSCDQQLGLFICEFVTGHFVKENLKSHC